MHFSQILNSLNHHSYFIHSFKDSVDHLKKYLKEKFNIEYSQNPDFFHEKYESLGIDEGRRIKDLHISKGFIEGGKKIFIIETDSITHEAQNALLKIFEEPNKNTHFFLIMPSIELLIPTLRSRLFVLNDADKESEEDVVADAKSFLKMNKKDRVEFVDDLVKKISDGEITRLEAIAFLSALEKILHENGVEKNKKSLEGILKVRDYISDRGASVKQLLEYIALVI